MTELEAASVMMSAWLPHSIVRVAVAFLEPSCLDMDQPFYWSAGFTKAISWRGGDPSWTIQVNLVDDENWSLVEVLAKDLPNSVQSVSVALTKPGMFQISVEGYNEKRELQDWCYCGSFGVGADGEFELSDNAIKLMSNLYPSLRAVEAVGRSSGAFNSIVMLRVANIDQHYVLRTRKHEPLSQFMFESITTTQTVVQELHEKKKEKLPFAVPRLILYDETVNNAVSRQFWLQTRVPGVALSEVIDELNVAQRVCLAREVAKCITAIYKAKKFPHCGGFVRNPVTGAAVVGCPLFFERVEDQSGGHFEYFHFVPGYSPPSNLHAFLKQRFEAVAKSSGGPAFKYFWQVAQQKLKEYGRRSSRKNRLVHTDFYPRNIMVKFTGGEPRIVGVVDWDQVEVLPPELAVCFNPGWLWSDEEEPLNGVDLQRPAADAEAEAVRVAFVEEMERLRPGEGFVARVARAQRCDLGVLGGLAMWGEDRRGHATPADFYSAGLTLVEAQGLLDALRADTKRFLQQ